MSAPRRVAWVSTRHRVCGIADYSKVLWPAIEAELKRNGGEGRWVELDTPEKKFRPIEAVLEDLIAFAPDVIHFQHEYGIWGGKNPPGYRFPRMVRECRRRLKDTRLLATAHTVLSPEYRFPVQGRGFQAPLRALANWALLPRLRKLWGAQTWGGLDGVIVHSQLQKETVSSAGPRLTAAIPHFVPVAAPAGTVARSTGGALPEALAALRDPALSGSPDSPDAQEKWVIVFGFFTPEKGQDVAIEAWSRLSDLPVRLVLAGGVRRAMDQKYFDQCLARIHELGLKEKVTTTGFVDSRHLDGLYARADLVLVPFRETSGSGSIAQAFARKAPVLGSDLPLNREINERQPGALEFFRSEDPEDLARAVRRLLSDEAARVALREAGGKYAAANSPTKIALRTLSLYEEVLL